MITCLPWQVYFSQFCLLVYILMYNDDIVHHLPFYLLKYKVLTRRQFNILLMNTTNFPNRKTILKLLQTNKNINENELKNISILKSL